MVLCEEEGNMLLICLISVGSSSSFGTSDQIHSFVKSYKILFNVYMGN